MKPVLLDLCCGAGGATRGYTQFIGGQILDWLNHQEGAIA